MAGSSLDIAVLTYLLGAALYDARHRRIPNGLIVAMIATGLALQWAAVGKAGAVAGVLGFGCGLLGLLPFYLAGVMGGGDAKLMGASGVFLGPAYTVVALFYTLIAGGVIALAVVLRASHSANRAGRSHRGFAYAGAIAAGVGATLLQTH